MILEDVLTRFRGGEKMRRTKWDAEKFIFVFQGYPNGMDALPIVSKAFHAQVNKPLKLQSHIMEHLGNNSFIPYTFSSEDILASDWTIC